MSDELLPYYERELAFLRQMGGEFAAKYPKIAGRLVLEGDKTEDPHLERLIQAVGFLTARIQHKLDDELPEITDALLGILYPHYLAPIPSMSIAQFVADADQGQLTGAFHVPRGAALFTQPTGGTPCRFRTCYPVTLWPLEVASARIEPPSLPAPVPRGAAAVLRLGLRCLGGTKLADLKLDRLCFFLDGEGPLAYGLYELLFASACEVQLRGAAKGPAIVLSSDCLRPVGLSEDQGMLPYTARSFLGYRLLHEYFTFPEKFLFFEVSELERAAAAGWEEQFEILVFLRRMPRFEQPVGPDNFRLGCTPVVNLFEQIAEPIRVSHAVTEYRVVPDVRRQSATEVYAIDSVVSASPGQPEPVRFAPFYSFRHAYEREHEQAFWYAMRRPSPRKGDPGTEVYLSLVDLNFRPTAPAADTLTLHTTCTNRDLPGKLPFGGEKAYFSLQKAAPVTHIACLRKPTDTIRPPLERGGAWRLISHLALNYLSVCEGGREALQEILRLYDFSDSAVVRQQIAGITSVTSRRTVARPVDKGWEGFCRGLQVSIEFDEEKYVGSGVFLFASVLEQFLILYVSLNSFVQLIATTRQREEPLKRWPPRAGTQILL